MIRTQNLSIAGRGVHGDGDVHDAEENHDGRIRHQTAETHVTEKPHRTLLRLVEIRVTNVRRRVTERGHEA